MKKSLFALGIVLLSGTSALAMDVSNPFYIPMKGDFLSETVLSYENGNHGNYEALYGLEELSYGITDKLTVSGSISDVWLLDQPGTTGHDRYDNPNWKVGLKYNLVDCCKTNWKVQLGADFAQAYNEIHNYKEVSGYGKIGYVFEKETMPYVTAGVIKPVGQYESEPIYTARAALYKKWGKHIATDIGAIYTWGQHTDEYATGSKHSSDWVLDAEIDYVFSDCMSVGLGGAYVLDARPENYDYYTVGVNFKVAF
jgi:hypothetical protein